MLDNILDLVKNVAGETIANNAEVPADKKDITIQTTTSAVTDGLKNNIGNIAGLFGSGDSSALINNIEDTVVSTLVEKVGLNSNTANSIASAVIPAVVKALSGKVNDPNDKGFSLESVVEAFGGGSGIGGLLGKIGGLFGK